MCLFHSSGDLPTDQSVPPSGGEAGFDPVDDQENDGDADSDEDSVSDHDAQPLTLAVVQVLEEQSEENEEDEGDDDDDKDSHPEDSLVLALQPFGGAPPPAVVQKPEVKPVGAKRAAPTASASGTQQAPMSKKGKSADTSATQDGRAASTSTRKPGRGASGRAGGIGQGHAGAANTTSTTSSSMGRGANVAPVIAKKAGYNVFFHHTHCYYCN